KFLVCGLLLSRTAQQDPHLVMCIDRARIEGDGLVERLFGLCVLLSTQQNSAERLPCKTIFRSALQHLAQYGNRLVFLAPLLGQQTKIIIRSDLVRFDAEAMTKILFCFIELAFQEQKRAHRIIKERIVWMLPQQTQEERASFYVLFLSYVGRPQH